LGWFLEKEPGVVQPALDGRSFLADSTIPKNELIALCWATTEKKPMAIFHRNRALQIRSSMDLSNLYHVRTDCNPSDIGTRPSKVTMDDIGPDSRWELGDAWMRLKLDEAIAQGVLQPPVSEFKMTKKLNTGRE
jgi:hypothetical protein